LKASIRLGLGRAKISGMVRPAGHSWIVGDDRKRRRMTRRRFERRRKLEIRNHWTPWKNKLGAGKQRVPNGTRLLSCLKRRLASHESH
jgi:hypothetical protein